VCSCALKQSCLTTRQGVAPRIPLHSTKRLAPRAGSHAELPQQIASLGLGELLRKAMSRVTEVAAAAETNRSGRCGAAQPMPHDVVWIRHAQARLILGPEAEMSSWHCGAAFPSDAEGDTICTHCRWFDVEQGLRGGGAQQELLQPSSPSTSFEASHPPATAALAGAVHGAVHYDCDITASECLDGSFLDSDNLQAWLHRDELVHRGRYAAVCVPALDSEVKRLVVLSCFFSLVISCLCVFCRRSVKRRTVPQVDADDKAERSARSIPEGCRDRNSDEVKESVQPVDAQAAQAEQIIAEIHEELMDSVELPQAERKEMMRKHLRRWHPDKNAAEFQEAATQVLQYLNAQRNWFLADTAVPEAATLLPRR